MFDWFRDHRISLAVVAGFAPVSAHIAMAVLAPGQDNRTRLFYGLKELAKTFTPVVLQEPGEWTHENHPHVKAIFPFYSDGSESRAAVWGAFKAHNIFLTYLPILAGIGIHKLADHTGINEKLEEAGFPFDI